MHQIIKDHIEEIISACEHHNVKKLFAFGSVCTDRFNDQSDIDLLISFNEMDFADKADHYFELADELEVIFKRSVDLTTDQSLSNPYFIETVNQTKTHIYG